MAISIKTSKMLWGRAAGRCCMPSCRIPLVLDETETDDPALIGEMCHMVGESENGPRGISPLTADQRDLYANLILLCRNHHGAIDRQPANWPLERLQSTKTTHEQWVKQSLPGYDIQKQQDDETYAGYVDEWARQCHLPLWTEWTSWALSGGQPQLSVELNDDLKALRIWLLKRIWPSRYPSLELALGNFSYVLQDFQNVFLKYAEAAYEDAELLTTRKFYKIDKYDKDLYFELHAKYEDHVDLVQDLLLELTRAANLVCDEIRANLTRSYRMAEGRLSVQTSLNEDLSSREFVVQYSDQERALPMPYPGLSVFLTIRQSRDRFFGGSPSD